MDKRFIEESFPVKEVGLEASREKSLRKGYISTFHLWWSRKPLASSRSTIYASLINSSEDEIELIKEKNFIIDLSKWKNSLNDDIIKKAKKEILNSNQGKVQKVLDPFAGGGSIPFESLRLGCETYSCDYNPVAVLIQKCTLEYPQKYGKRILEDVRKWGNLIFIESKKELKQFYKTDTDVKGYFNKSTIQETIIGYVWFRTINCQNPSCELEIPLTTHYWLAKKKKDNVAIFPFVHNNKINFKIVGDRFKKIPDDFDPDKGTVSRAIVKCPFCGSTIDGKDVRESFQKGNSNHLMVAVVSQIKGNRGKEYRIISDADLETFKKSTEFLETKINLLKSQLGIELIPNEKLDNNSLKQRDILRYGMKNWEDLFNNRQKLAIITFIEKIRDSYNKMISEGLEKDYAKAIITYLAMGVDRLADYGSTLCMINPTGGRGVKNTFGRQALPMVWNYMESNPLNPIAAGWITACKKNEEWIEHILKSNLRQGFVTQASATDLPYNDNFFDAVFTDPPYYDSIQYSELSDFFYVWLKRIIGDLYPELFITPLTPKSKELVANPVRHTRREKSKEFFEMMLKKSFDEIERVLKYGGITNIVYAYKTTEGWETVINALLDSGLNITASWPISTERKGRLNAIETASLASSIYIVARKIKKEDIGWFKEVKTDIENYVPKKLDKLWEEGISGADFFIAAIGSAIEIFGRYKKVLDREGNEIRADKLLSFVRYVVTDYTVRQILHNGIADELSPLTKFYVLWRWNYQEVKVPFDEARKLAQSAGIDLSKEWNKGFIEKSREFVNVMGPNKRDIKSLKDSAELVDVLHYACLLWKEGKKDEMKLILKESGYGEGETLYKVAQAISETLSNNSFEKKMIEGFLAGRNRIMQDMREDDSQTKLV